MLGFEADLSFPDQMIGSVPSAVSAAGTTSISEEADMFGSLSGRIGYARGNWMIYGLGGFASSTIAGVNTRRYHGLLTAATKPPAVRTCLLSKLEETLVLNDRAYELSANCYLGAVHPRGFQYLKEFSPSLSELFLCKVY